MRTLRILVAAIVVFSAACGDDDDDGAKVDGAVVADASAGQPDGAAPGTPDGAVPGGPDAAPGTPDGAPPSTPDASTDRVDAGGNDCGKIGMICGSDEDCGAGIKCESGGGGMFCTVDRPGCGGFAGDTCDDPSAPICTFVTGGDFGPCLTAAELACICEQSPGAIDGC